MAQSCALRERDFRAIWRVIGECRELGDAPILWRQHFLASLSPLVDADVSNGGEMAVPVSGPPRDLGVTEWGWHAGFNRQGWVVALERFHRGDIDPVFFPPLFALLKRQGRITVPRAQFADDRRWHRSDLYQDAAKVV